MGALPSQKYKHILVAFARWYNAEQTYLENEITEEMVMEFLLKCNKGEVEL